MNLDERETAEPFGLGKETIERIPCDVFFCKRYAEDFEPIIINGRHFCDICGSDVAALQIEKVGTWKE